MASDNFHLTATTMRFFYPIVRVHIYNTSLEVIREARNQTIGGNGSRDNNQPLPKRGKIKQLSRKSLSRLAFLARETTVKMRSLLTLTYGDPYPNSGAYVKMHLNYFLTSLRKNYPAVEYLWFLEFQKRGAPHIHLCLNFEPSDLDRHAAAFVWAEGVSRRWEPMSLLGGETPKRLFDNMFKVHTHQSQWANVKKVDGVARYVTKYASKPEQKLVPLEFQDVGRFWGASKGLKPKPIVSNVDMTESELREYLLDHGRDMEKYDIIPRYVWLID